LVPPLGIASLKCFSQTHGYRVTAVDANIEDDLREGYTEYFSRLKEYIPENKRRHLYNIGHEVLKNHMMAHFNYKVEKEYCELVKILVANTFFHEIDAHQVLCLNRIIKEFFSRLECYVVNLLEREKPTVLGLSVYGSTLAASLFTFKLAKERYPQIKTVMGGGIFSSELEIHRPDFDYFLEKTPYIDKIIVGEGEELFLRFLRGDLSPSQRVVTIKDIHNNILDLSSLGVPDFSDFQPGYYVQMASFTSRSCPFQCNFCVETTYWGKYRKRTATQIADELLHLYKMYGRRLFLMCDSLLNPVIDELPGKLLGVRPPLYWGGYLRVDTRVCDVENTLQWRRGGFYRARLGVESGSQRILDLMGKKIDIRQAKSAIAALAYAGIKTTVMFVIGYPGETDHDFQETLELVEELKDDIYEADCNPFWYFFSGQGNSEEWVKNNNPRLLYPRNAREMLLLQTWTLGGEPSREVSYTRVNRFIQHCSRLKIPNPYSLHETNLADERWKTLHKNAVPSLMEINNNDVPGDECSRVKSFSPANYIPEDNGIFNFKTI
jgi:radical SAM superfamily enzyme YgiQ (UPF0313 family)